MQIDKQTQLSRGAIAGQLVFTLGWIVAGALEPDGYSSARHDTSDLAAMTAHYAPVILWTQAIAGVLTIAFALGALGPALFIERRRSVGPWLVAGSLVGLELITELIFRLDCRAVDAGCTPEAAMTSWHGKLHLIVGLAAMVMTVAAPFVLAQRMRLLKGWRDLARPAMVFGGLQILAPILYGVFHGSPATGYLNRAPLVLASIGLVTLALRTLKLARPG
jgi:hypothetical protein